jgi:hypothetical protein
MGVRGSSLRPRNLRRRMSVKGAIKKTRSINVDCKYILLFVIDVIQKINPEFRKLGLKHLILFLSLFFPLRPSLILFFNFQKKKNSLY